jgi:hypothetical protein
LYLSIAVIFLVFGHVQAAPASNSNASTVKLHFIAVTSIPASLRLKQGDVYQELALSAGSFTTTTTQRSSPALTLYVETKNAAGKTLYKPYASVPWPAENEDAVAMVAASELGGTETGYLVLFPDSRQVHPEHSMRVINGSRVKVALKVGEAQAVLAPGEAMMAPYDPNEEKLLLGLAVATTDGAWRLVYSTNIVPARNHRAFAILRSLSQTEIVSRELAAEAATFPDVALLYDCTTVMPPPPPLPLPAK